MATVLAGAAALPQLCLRVTSSSAPVHRRRAAASVRCGSARGAAAPERSTGGALEEDHYRTLRLAPGATRREVKKAFHRLALQYHPDVVRRGEDDSEAGVDFHRINVAYQRVMSNIQEAEARLEYWRARYGLADEDLDRYRRYLSDDDDWFADL